MEGTEPEVIETVQPESNGDVLVAGGTKTSVVDEMWPPYCNPQYVMPEEIEVKVAMQTGEYFFPVGISKFSGHKPYLGGFRNVMNGLLYHHGSSQTPTENKFAVKDTSDLRSRETQTYEYKTLSVQSVRECGTQMQRADVSINGARDIILKPRPYFTAEQLNEVKISKCVIIQRTWRGYVARCRAFINRKKNLDHTIKEQSDIQEKARQDKEERAQDMLRRLHPVSNHDFEKLYNELEQWRISEAAKIKATTTPGAERKKLMANLLANETKSLQSIQKLKVSARKNDHELKTQKLLELMSKPYRWQMSNGETAFVQTQAVAKANDLVTMYAALREIQCISVDERLNVLYQLKQIVTTSANDYYTAVALAAGVSTVNGVIPLSIINKHKSNSNITLLKDMTDLIDREADMLSRGRPSNSLASMRTRLNNLFLSYIENPVYNPRAIEFVNIPKATTANAEDFDEYEDLDMEERYGNTNGNGNLPIPPPQLELDTGM